MTGRSRNQALAAMFVVAALGANLLRADPVEQVDRVGPAAQAAHAMLTRLCDDFGGRVTGRPANQAALERLVQELRGLGLQPEVSTFSMPGWERGRDEVALLTPVARELRAVAFGYSQPAGPFEAAVVAIGNGRASEYPVGDVAGKVGLLDGGRGVPLRDIVRVARERGLRALLFVNRVDGGRLLARTGSFIGEPLAVPALSLTQEEGSWMQRLLARGKDVRVRVEIRSHCRPVETANVIVRLPGKTAERVIVGAHFDSWDQGQGAIDNGLGTAQLFALAHALRGERLRRTIELVWFNGEELGLWGSIHAAGQLGEAPVVAMMNLDMVGVPQAVNALGNESLVAWLERWNDARGAERLPGGVQNQNWFGSDHTPYQVAGIRTVTFHGPIDPAAVRYYHDFADTIDKLPEKLVHDSSAVITSLVLALASDSALRPERRAPGEVRAFLAETGIEERMRDVGWWPFPAPPAGSDRREP
ncbi:M28 family peptidase [Opitutus sp. ER46]|uniref:M28 family peptidase n=1 Tax=Opitutus sp. ER46 TaxID=2161864 RepID=UPI000D30166A|nr:M28 family peptidase [Opitutus sp. ER46]PTX94471.1 hypothetical protein DB354_12055 [Opitutus sp. ER46]